MITWLGGLVVPAVVIGLFVAATRLADSVPRLRHASRPWYWRSRRSVQALVAAVVVVVIADTAWYVHRETTFARQAAMAVWVGGWMSFLTLPRVFRALHRWDRRHVNTLRS